MCFLFIVSQAGCRHSADPPCVLNLKEKKTALMLLKDRNVGVKSMKMLYFNIFHFQPAAVLIHDQMFTDFGESELFKCLFLF